MDSICRLLHMNTRHCSANQYHAHVHNKTEVPIDQSNKADIITMIVGWPLLSSFLAPTPRIMADFAARTPHRVPRIPNIGIP